jgi:hypothetical protein
LPVALQQSYSIEPFRCTDLKSGVAKSKR